MPCLNIGIKIDFLSPLIFFLSGLFLKVWGCLYPRVLLYHDHSRAGIPRLLYYKNRSICIEEVYYPAGLKNREQNLLEHKKLFCFRHLIQSQNTCHMLVMIFLYLPQRPIGPPAKPLIVFPGHGADF